LLLLGGDALFPAPGLGRGGGLGDGLLVRLLRGGLWGGGGLFNAVLGLLSALSLPARRAGADFLLLKLLKILFAFLLDFFFLLFESLPSLSILGLLLFPACEIWGVLLPGEFSGKLLSVFVCDCDGLGNFSKRDSLGAWGRSGLTLLLLRLLMVLLRDRIQLDSAARRPVPPRCSRAYCEGRLSCCS